MALVLPYPIGATTDVTGYSDIYDSFSASGPEIYVVFSLEGKELTSRSIIGNIILKNGQKGKPRGPPNIRAGRVALNIL